MTVRHRVGFGTCVRGHLMAGCGIFGRSSDDNGALVVCLLSPVVW